MTETAQLAEVGKERITAAAAIELVKKFVKDRYKADKAQCDRALAEAKSFAGGQVEHVDKDVIDQGRQWATRLALISRQTSGSGYQASRANAALVPIVKKLFGVIGELEAIVATDTEMSLFQKITEEDYYGGLYGQTGLKQLKVSDLQESSDPGEQIDHGSIVDQIHDMAGNKIADAVVELLDQYEIEPIVVPGEAEEGAPAKPARRRRNS